MASNGGASWRCATPVQTRIDSTLNDTKEQLIMFID